MSTTQRQTHEKKFDSSELFQNEEQVQDTQPQICHLSVKPEEANLTSLPFETVKRVFQNAEALLSKENAIVSAPGSNEMAFMMKSKTSKRPHYVFAEKSGKLLMRIVRDGLLQICVNMPWQLGNKHSNRASIWSGSEDETHP